MEIKNNNIFYANSLPKANKSLAEASSFFQKNESTGVNFSGFEHAYTKPLKNYLQVENVFKECLGPNLRKIINGIVEQDPSLIKATDEGISFLDKGFKGNLIDTVFYPFLRMPFDLLDFGLINLKKIPFLKDLKLIKKLDNWTPLVKTREKNRLEADFTAVKGLYEYAGVCIEKGADLNAKIFKRSLKNFDEKFGNYNTVLERSSNRIVSGIVPAIYLASDAYNVYIETKGDKKGASEEAKVRLHQELTRLVITAYLQLIALGAVTKYANKSQLATIACILAPVLISESFSRYFQNKPLTFLSKEGAVEFNKKVAKKEGKEYVPPSQNSKKVGETLKEISIDKNLFKNFVTEQKTDTKHENSILTLENAATAIGGIILGGFAVAEVAKHKKIKPALDYVKTRYAKLMNKLSQVNYTISKPDFNRVMKALDDNGFCDIAEHYKKYAKRSWNAKSGMYTLETVDSKKAPFVRFLIAPFSFVIKGVISPYTLTKNFIDVIAPLPKKKNKKGIKLDYAMTAAIKKLSEDLKKMPPEDVHSYIRNKILSSFNVETKSSYSNGALGPIVSFWSRLLTSYFLIVDDHGIVMRATNGEKEDEAWVKAKSRFIQRFASMLAGTMFIDLFNKTFIKFYHGSLAGASLVTIACSIVIENFTRWSIGMPTKASSKEEIMALREKHEKRDDIVGRYFRFMTKITGKEQIHRTPEH